MNHIKRFLAPPVFDDQEKTLTARLLHPLLLVVLLLMVVAAPLFILAAPAERLRLGFGAGVIIIASILMLWLERRGHLRLASYLFVSIIWLVLTILVFTGSGTIGPAFLAGYLALVAMAGLLLDVKGGFLIASANTLAGLALLIAARINAWESVSFLSPLANWLIAVFFFWMVAIMQSIFSRLRQQALQQVQDELADRRQAELALQQSIEVTHAISSALDLETVVSTVVRLGTEVVGAEMGSLALLSPDGEALIETYNHNMPASLFNSQPFLRGEGLGWTVVQSGLPVNIARYPDHPDAMQYAIDANIQAFMGVPVTAGEQPLGVLKLFRIKTDQPFSTREQELAVAIGQQAGIYIQNARLFEQTQRRAQQLSTLNDVGQAVATLRDLPALLEVIYEQAKRSLAPEVYYIGLLNPGTGQVTIPFMFDSGKRWDQPPIPITETSIANHVIQSHQPSLVNRTPEELVQPAPPHSQIGDTTRRAASLMFAPLLAGDQVIGVISAQSYTLNRYHEDDLTLLVGFANHVAIAIQNAKLFEETRHQLDELSILHQVSTTAVEVGNVIELLQRAAYLIGQRLYSDDLSIWLFDENKQVLEDRAHFNQAIESPLPSKPIRLGEGIIGNVAGNLQTMLVPDVALEPHYLAFYPWVRSELCVPIHIGEHLIGAINAESKEIDAFKEADERLLVTIAGLLAMAVERLRSEAEMEQRVHDRTTDLEAANHELESFSYSVSHDLRAPLRGIEGYSRLLQDDHGAQLNPEGRYYLDMVRAGAQRMGHLIDDLLQFSRLSRQPINKQTILPSLLVEEILVELRPLYVNRQIEVVQHSLPACQADPGLLIQVLMNLIENAFKYTSTRDIARVEIGCLQQDGLAIYYVRDNGIGLDMQFCDRIFGVFQRLHRQDEFEGTGVGLAIVQRIIQRHGGKVWVEAEVDKGATFFFTL